MTLRLLPATDGVQWDRLVRATPSGSSFHTWSWLHLQTRLLGLRFVPLLVEDDDDAIGVVPLVTSAGLVQRGVRPPFPYVGPVVPHEHLPAVLDELRRWQLRHAMPVLRLELGPEAVGAEPLLRAHGYDTEPDATFVVPLRNRTPADLERALSSRRRRALRQADQYDITIRRSVPGDVAVLLPRLLDEAFQSRGVPSPYPQEIGTEIERWAAGDDDVFATTALLHGEPVGVQVALADQDTVYAWAGGSLRNQRRSDPFTVLAMDLFRWSLDRGHHAIDLVGAVDAGISAFKRSLGGVERAYVAASSMRVPRTALHAYRAVRRFRSVAHAPAQPAH